MLYFKDMHLELDDQAKVRRTHDGYMTAVPRVARTGIQLYRGSELGRRDQAVVKIYRDENEVFNKDSLATFVGKPFTNDHPPKMVDAANWKKYSVGVTGEDILRDGQFIRVPMALMDAATIKKVEAGKVQLSVGYGCEIDWTPGTTPQGEAYDGRQVGIVVNHIAVVDAARGGKELSIGDGETNHLLYGADGNSATHVETEDTNNMKTMVIDGITCEMSDTAIQVVTRALDAAKGNFEQFKKKSEEEEKKAKDALDSANSQVAKLTTDLATASAKITTLETQLKDSELTPAKLDAMVKDRAIIGDKAKVLLPTVVVDGKSIDEIMRQVVDARVGEAAKGWTPEQIKTSFDTLTAGVQAQAHDGVSRTAQAFSHQPVGDAAPKVKAYDGYDKRLTEAWKTPAGAA